MGSEAERSGIKPSHRLQEFIVSYQPAIDLLEQFEVRFSAKGELAGQPKNFRNIYKHSLTVGLVANSLLKYAHTQGLISLELIREGTMAALLHDLTKRQELEYELGTTTSTPRFLNPGEKKDFIATLLKEKQVSPHIHHLLRLTEYVGDGSWNLPDTYQPEMDKPEEVVKWVLLIADSMVSGASIVDWNDRFEDIIRAGKYSQLYQWWGKTDNYETDARTMLGKSAHFMTEVWNQIGNGIPLVDYVTEKLTCD